MCAFSQVGALSLQGDPLTLDPYPLSDEMFDRSIPYSTPDLLFHRSFQRARDRGILRVVVIGGSVTFGHQCTTPTGLTARECAWPRRLEQWFENEIEDFSVEVRVLEVSFCVRFVVVCVA